MDYEQFITEIQKYWDLRKKGLKKQANSFLFSFTKSFKENVPDADADAVLFQFCREYLDEMKFPGDALPRRHLPFQLTKLLDDYLSRECEKNQMPQMRWAYQIFGNVYNPHNPKLEYDFYPILERAYMHEKCDPQTSEQLSSHRTNFSVNFVEEPSRILCGSILYSEMAYFGGRTDEELEQLMKQMGFKYVWMKSQDGHPVFNSAPPQPPQERELKSIAPVLRFLCKFAGIEGKGAKEESIERAGARLGASLPLPLEEFYIWYFRWFSCSGIFVDAGL